MRSYNGELHMNVSRTLYCEIIRLRLAWTGQPLQMNNIMPKSLISHNCNKTEELVDQKQD